MALIIKGDRLPKKCDWCFYRSRCSAYARKVKEIIESEHEQIFDVFGEMRLSDCPISEIPDEHGDLIDRSFLKGASYEIMRFPDDEANKMYHELIDNAPTVVEASK